MDFMAGIVYRKYITAETLVAAGIIKKVIRVARRGDSLGIRIPKEAVDQLNLKEARP
jgi:N-acetylglucosamine kinase-like BadF-type ATPase